MAFSRVSWWAMVCTFSLFCNRPFSLLGAFPDVKLDYGEIIWRLKDGDLTKIEQMRAQSTENNMAHIFPSDRSIGFSKAVKFLLRSFVHQPKWYLSLT